jgi:hypothetical protein
MRSGARVSKVSLQNAALLGNAKPTVSRRIFDFQKKHEAEFGEAEVVAMF